MIGRIGHRRAFQRLVHDGRRARSETLWCTYLDDPDAMPPRVAFSIGRSVGSAVMRNRVRRRLRAIVSSMAGRPPLVSGWLLVGARPGVLELTFEQLAMEVRTLLAALTARPV